MNNFKKAPVRKNGNGSSLKTLIAAATLAVLAPDCVPAVAPPAGIGYAAVKAKLDQFAAQIVAKTMVEIDGNKFEIGVGRALNAWPGSFIAIQIISKGPILEGSYLANKIGNHPITIDPDGQIAAHPDVSDFNEPWTSPLSSTGSLDYAGETPIRLVPRLPSNNNVLLPQDIKELVEKSSDPFWKILPQALRKAYEIAPSHTGIHILLSILDPTGYKYLSPTQKSGNPSTDGLSPLGTLKAEPNNSGGFNITFDSSIKPNCSTARCDEMPQVDIRPGDGLSQDPRSPIEKVTRHKPGYVTFGQVFELVNEFKILEDAPIQGTDFFTQAGNDGCIKGYFSHLDVLNPQLPIITFCDGTVTGPGGSPVKDGPLAGAVIEFVNRGIVGLQPRRKVEISTEPEHERPEGQGKEPTVQEIPNIVVDRLKGTCLELDPKQKAVLKNVEDSTVTFTGKCPPKGTPSQPGSGTPPAQKEPSPQPSGTEPIDSHKPAPTTTPPPPAEQTPSTSGKPPAPTTNPSPPATQPPATGGPAPAVTPAPTVSTPDTSGKPPTNPEKPSGSHGQPGTSSSTPSLKPSTHEQKPDCSEQEKAAHEAELKKRKAQTAFEDARKAAEAAKNIRDNLQRQFDQAAQAAKAAKEAKIKCESPKPQIVPCSPCKGPQR